MRLTIAVMEAVRLDFFVAACAAVILPAVTAVSISLLLSATNATIRATLDFELDAVDYL